MSLTEETTKLISDNEQLIELHLKDWIKEEKLKNVGINYKELLKFFNKIRAKHLGKSDITVISSKVKNAFKARLRDGYSKRQIVWAIQNAFKDDFHSDENFKFLTIGYFSRSDTIDRFGIEPTKTMPKTPKAFNR